MEPEVAIDEAEVTREFGLQAVEAHLMWRRRRGWGGSVSVCNRVLDALRHGAVFAGIAIPAMS